MPRALVTLKYALITIVVVVVVVAVYVIVLMLPVQPINASVFICVDDAMERILVFRQQTSGWEGFEKSNSSLHGEAGEGGGLDRIYQKSNWRARKTKVDESPTISKTCHIIVLIIVLILTAVDVDYINNNKKGSMKNVDVR